jgi:hypothetical protein
LYIGLMFVLFSFPEFHKTYSKGGRGDRLAGGLYNDTSIE